MSLKPSSKIFLSESKIPNAGRGVFAVQKIRKDDLIERCPVIFLPAQDVPALQQTKLLNYYFGWGKDLLQAGICLGFGSLYNHSYTPNATYKKFFAEEVIEFVALRDIQINEEITVNYNHGDPDDTSPLWMEDVPAVK